MSELKEKNENRMDGLNCRHLELNKYRGKKKNHICFVPKTLILSSIIIPLLPLLGLITSFEIFGRLVFLEIICIALFFINRIKLSPQGVSYQKKFFKWEDIKTIGIAVTKKGTPHKGYSKMIYITTCEYNQPIHIIYRSRKREEIFKPNFYVNKIFFKEVKQDFIIASFNRRLVHNIMAYWGTDIKNIDDVVGWYTYVKWYNFWHKRNQNKGK